ncbi:hypothetical protein DTO021C3_6806 [Paecilomyces variotii]|nr:hypothetical protein DTO021C3_6806 [Paecilomyces variotii]
MNFQMTTVQTRLTPRRTITIYNTESGYCQTTRVAASSRLSSPVTPSLPIPLGHYQRCRDRTLAISDSVVVRS